MPQCSRCRRTVRRLSIREEAGGRVLRYCSMACLRAALRHRRGGHPEG